MRGYSLGLFVFGQLLMVDGVQVRFWGLGAEVWGLGSGLRA